MLELEVNVLLQEPMLSGIVVLVIEPVKDRVPEGTQLQLNRLGQLIPRKTDDRLGPAHGAIIVWRKIKKLFDVMLHKHSDELVRRPIGRDATWSCTEIEHWNTFTLIVLFLMFCEEADTVINPVLTLQLSRSPNQISPLASRVKVKERVLVNVVNLMHPRGNVRQHGQR